MAGDEESFGVSHAWLRRGREALHMLPGDGPSYGWRWPCKGKSPRTSEGEEEKEGTERKAQEIRRRTRALGLTTFKGELVLVSFSYNKIKTVFHCLNCIYIMNPMT